MLVARPDPAGAPPDPPRPARPPIPDVPRCAPRGAHRVKGGDPTAPPFTASRVDSALGLPEDLGDLVDRVEQLLTLRRVLRLLRGAGFFRRVPEQVVQVLVLLEVLGLEVVGPQHPEVVLHEIGTLFFDEDRAIPEDRVVAALILLLAGLDRLGLDAGLRGVVDTARKVAVRVDRATGCEDAMEHGPTPSSRRTDRTALGLGRSARRAGERILSPRSESGVGRCR